MPVIVSAVASADCTATPTAFHNDAVAMIRS
jgi:hypothetical protein